MPNYRYRSPEYMRRTNGVRNTAMSQNCSQAQAASEPVVTSSACCDNSAEYDELSGMALAMAYVPWQEWRALLEPEKALCCGTIFEELNKPFLGSGGCGR